MLCYNFLSPGECLSVLHVVSQTKLHGSALKCAEVKVIAPSNRMKGGNLGASRN